MEKGSRGHLGRSIRIKSLSLVSEEMREMGNLPKASSKRLSG